MLLIFLITFIMLVIAASQLAAAVGGPRHKTLIGWSLVTSATSVAALGVGVEVGVAKAFALFPIAALVWVGTRITRKPWRRREGFRENDPSPLRRDGVGLMSLRWTTAGPLALFAAVVPTAAVTVWLSGGRADALVLALVISLCLWAVLAAWAFLSRRPVRTAAVTVAISLVGVGLLLPTVLQ